MTEISPSWTPWVQRVRRYVTSASPDAQAARLAGGGLAVPGLRPPDDLHRRCVLCLDDPTADLAVGARSPARYPVDRRFRAVVGPGHPGSTAMAAVGTVRLAIVILWRSAHAHSHYSVDLALLEGLDRDSCADGSRAQRMLLIAVRQGRLRW